MLQQILKSSMVFVTNSWKIFHRWGSIAPEIPIMFTEEIQFTGKLVFLRFCQWQKRAIFSYVYLLDFFFSFPTSQAVPVDIHSLAVVFTQPVEMSSLSVWMQQVQAAITVVSVVFAYWLQMVKPLGDFFFFDNWLFVNIVVSMKALSCPLNDPDGSYQGTSRD